MGGGEKETECERQNEESDREKRLSERKDAREIPLYPTH